MLTQKVPLLGSGVSNHYKQWRTELLEETCVFQVAVCGGMTAHKATGEDCEMFENKT